MNSLLLHEFDAIITEQYLLASNIVVIIPSLLYDGNTLILEEAILLINSLSLTFPKKFLKTLAEDDKVSYLFWRTHFDVEERIQISRDKLEVFILHFVKINAPNKILYNLLDLKQDFIALLLNLRKKIFPKSYLHYYMDTPEFISKE